MIPTPVRLTPAVLQALEIIRDHGPLRPSRFARWFYPKDHPGWKRVCKCGYGSHRGGGLVSGCGGWLAKIAHAGLIMKSRYNDEGYILTTQGIEVLVDAGRPGHRQED